MSTKVWLCPNCVPKEEFEELTLGTIFATACGNCGNWASPLDIHCVRGDTYERWLKEGKIPNHGCTRCKVKTILADTEDWKNPLCYECWEELGEPEEEPEK